MTLSNVTIPSTLHDYTNFGVSNAIRGNPTTVARYVTQTSSLSTTNVYDVLGNVLSTTDPAGKTTSFSYADNWSGASCGVPVGTQAYATTMTNALSQPQQTGYYAPDRGAP
jgi:YD repeat-containing protein